MRRSAFLEHVAWTGAGIAYAMSANGIFEGRALAAAPATVEFVQISDSHLGFKQAANPDVASTLKASIDAINAMPVQPSFVVHTGDVTHLSKPEQFTVAKDLLSTLKAPLIVLPGEHDFIGADPNKFFEIFPSEKRGEQWRSWDASGVHYIALVNVFDFETMGKLGSEQLAWLKNDLTAVHRSMPIVVFAHVPLYALYPQWGWTTEDGSQALAMLARFDRVTVLNGHIHQVIIHQEGSIRFASANATAYPQPAPGTAPKPGPVTLPRNALLHAIGYRSVELSNDGRAAIGEHALG